MLNGSMAPKVIKNSVGSGGVPYFVFVRIVSAQIPTGATGWTRVNVPGNPTVGEFIFVGMLASSSGTSELEVLEEMPSLYMTTVGGRVLRKSRYAYLGFQVVAWLDART